MGTDRLTDSLTHIQYIETRPSMGPGLKMIVIFDIVKLFNGSYNITLVITIYIYVWETFFKISKH